MITLQVGNKAPLFSGKDQNGNIINLKNYTGKKLILYFYPHDLTPTCTTQACNLKDNYKTLLQKSFDIIGISSDDVATHKKFETKYQLPFTLIADTDNTIALKYGVWDWKKFMGKTFIGMHRTTFIINPRGIIDHIILKPKSKIHTQEILALMGE